MRYFNPVGAHPSGRIGEDPVGIPNNLMPYIMQVAVGRRDHLTVHGDDYPTPDGTAIRDYLHVMDLAEGHLAALDRIDRIEGVVPVNLGTGVGSSVLDVLRAARAATGRPVPAEIGPRRPGRRGGRVRRSGARRRPARLAEHPHPRRDVRRPLALAAGQPVGISRPRR